MKGKARRGNQLQQRKKAVKPGANKAENALAGNDEASAAASCEAARDVATSAILILRFKTPSQQHAALARIEAFYEGQGQGKKYLSMQEAAAERICRNYEGFNFPISAVHEWLAAMKAAIANDTRSKEDGSVLEDVAEGQPFWKEHCNPSECALLGYLASQGVVLDETSSSTPTSASINGPETSGIADQAYRLSLTDQSDQTALQASSERPPTYVISTLASNAALSTVLPHERQHALYHLNAGYATKCQSWFPVTRSLVENVAGSRASSSVTPKCDSTLTPPQQPLHSPAIMRTIAYELHMRGYAPHVWADEWQAYVSVAKDVFQDKEFGNKARDELVSVAAIMREESAKAWKEIV